MQSRKGMIFDIIVFQVKFWVTFNEPLEFISEGYAGTSAAPGLNDRLFLAVRAAHNVIRCHSKVYRLYVREFKSKQHGIYILNSHLSI